MMISIRVKTLDSTNHLFNVQDQMTVKEFKDEICPTVGIPVPEQRLIFKGRVLQDDKPLSEYGLEGNTVHLVQKPSNSTTNETPPVQPHRHRHQMGDFENGSIIFGGGGGGGDRNSAIIMGIGVPTIEIQGDQLPGGISNHPSAGTGRRNTRNSAAVRLQIGNNMLNNASTILQNLEEDGQEVSVDEESILVPQNVAVDSIFDGQPDISIEQEVEVQIEGSSPMDVDDDSFSRMISQVANAAYMATMGQGGGQNQNQRPSNPPSSSSSLNNNNNNSSNNNTSSSIPPPPSSSSSSSSATNSVNSENTTTGPRRTRPYEPRLREMAIGLQDLLAFHDRLTPHLRFLQRILRENRNYDQPEETQSMQYFFNNISSIMHLLGHSYHAFSDLKCDFSVDANNRRLQASSSILVEQSTLVRATIPISMSSIVPRINQNQNQTSTSATTTATSPTTGTTGNSNSRSSTTSSSSTTTSTTSSSSTTSSNSTASFGTYIANLINQAGGGVGGQGIIGLGGGPTAQSSEITEEMRDDLLRLAHEHMGDMGQGDGHIGHEIRIGFGTSSSEPRQRTTTTNSTTSTNRQQQQQPRQQNPSNSNGNSNGQNRRSSSSRTIGGITRPISSFDPFLGCHSSHLHNSSSNATSTSTRGTGQNNARAQETQQKPKNLKKYIKIDNSENETGSIEDVKYSYSIENNGDLFENIFDMIRCSNLIDTLHPILKDIIQNYLLRGRDVKNIVHVKTCARSMAKNLTLFLKSITDKIETRDMLVDFDGTYSNLLIKLFSDVIRLTLECEAGRSYRLSIVRTLEDFFHKIFAIFRVCLKSPNIPEIFSNSIIEKYFSGMSILFKSYASSQLESYFKDFLSSQSEAALGPPQINYLSDTTTDNKESTTSTNTNLPLPNASASASSVGLVRAGSSNNLIMDVDSDDLEDHVPQKKVSRINSTSTLAAETPVASNMQDNLINNLPEDWRSMVRRDMQIQSGTEPTTEPPQPTSSSFSPGYISLYPRK